MIAEHIVIVHVVDSFSAIACRLGFVLQPNPIQFIGILWVIVIDYLIVCWVFLRQPNLRFSLSGLWNKD